MLLKIAFFQYQPTPVVFCMFTFFLAQAPVLLGASKEYPGMTRCNWNRYSLFFFSCRSWNIFATWTHSRARPKCLLPPLSLFVQLESSAGRARFRLNINKSIIIIITRLEPAYGLAGGLWGQDTDQAGIFWGVHYNLEPWITMFWPGKGARAGLDKYVRHTFWSLTVLRTKF